MSDDTPAVVGDLDDPERPLWVVPKSSPDSRTVHTETDCRGIGGKEVLQTKACKEHDETDVCSFCSGAWSGTVFTGEQTATKIKGAWDDD